MSRQATKAIGNRYYEARMRAAKMKEAAWEKYHSETTKPGEGWGAGMRKARLSDNKAWERARERYMAICAELERRRADEAGN